MAISANSRDCRKSQRVDSWLYLLPEYDIFFMQICMEKAAFMRFEGSTLHLANMCLACMWY